MNRLLVLGFVVVTSTLSSQGVRAEEWYDRPGEYLDIERVVIDTVWQKPSARSASSPGCCITISISYPVLRGEIGDETISNLNSIVSRFLNDNLELEEGTSIQQRVELEVDSLRQLWRDFPDDKPSKYIVNSTGVWFGPGIMCLHMEEYSYPGGYRNRQRKVARNYELRTYAPIRLDDLFITDSRIALDSMGLVSFRKLRKLPANVDLRKYGFFISEDFTLTENFAMTDTGLFFTYNACEINGCSAGCSFVFLSWEQLKPVIRPDGPLGWVLREE